MSSEVKRRLVHASGTLVPLSYLLGVFTWEELRFIVLAGSILAIVLEFVRLSIGLDWIVYDALTREYEQDSVGGYALATFGGTVVIWAFEPQIAVPALLMLTIADPISGVLSSGQLRPAKQASVLFVTFGVCVFIASLFVPPPAAVLGALAATLADGVKPVISGYVIDDNLTIPIWSAVAMFVGVQYLSGSGF